ncbi:MAG TPA: choline ABC transporter permease subunit [Gemmobacter sp.]|nr:choline ABC transporter permease subunit [Gemmobacter sp.]
MDWLYSSDWLTEYKLPIGKWAKQIFTWLNENGGPVFEFLRFIMQSVIDGCLFVLTETPPLLIVAAFLGLTWYIQRSWKTVALVALSFLFILNQGYWEETMQSMTLILLSCVTCMGFGVPLGIMAAHRPRFYRAVSPVLDMMQTLPTFVYLIPAIVFFGIGMVPGLIATVIFVLPAPIRLTHLGVSSTPTALLEAATAFGATPWQRLWRVELPWALPQIMVGLTQSIMLSLSMVVIATMVGANGLGTPVVRALGTVDTRLGFESGFIIVVVAIMLDRMLKVTRK